MTGLSTNLSKFLGRTVLDKTGLTGTYDIKLEWVPMNIRSRCSAGWGCRRFRRSRAGLARATLFTALEEQLGLKLESQKGPVEMFTIERGREAVRKLAKTR